MTEITYLDPRSGATYPLATPRWCGDGQAPLMLTPLPVVMCSDTPLRMFWHKQLCSCLTELTSQLVLQLKTAFITTLHCLTTKHSQMMISLLSKSACARL